MRPHIGSAVGTFATICITALMLAFTVTKSIHMISSRNPLISYSDENGGFSSKDSPL
jgi:hypothetical protein